MSIVYDGTTFNNGGTATAIGTNLTEIRVDGATVWKKEIPLLDDASAWTLVPVNPDATDSRVATITDGALECRCHWWLPGGPIAYGIRRLTPCDSVSKISFEFRNSTQPFAQIATYIGIVGRGNHFPYYGTGSNAGGSDRASNNNNVDDAFKIGSKRFIMFPTGSATGEAGGKAHGWTSHTFDFGSPVDLTNYWFIVSVSVQSGDGDIGANVAIRNLKAI